MESLTDFLKENSTGIIVGAVLAGILMYLMMPAQSLPRATPTETYQQPPSTGQQFTYRQPAPRRHPWFPGAPRNPSECLQRGGIDVGTGCRGWH